MKEKVNLKEQVCKIHRQPFFVVCVYCARDERKEREQHPPERFRDIANGE